MENDHGMTPEELAALTPEERAAILEDDDDDDDDGDEGEEDLSPEAIKARAAQAEADGDGKDDQPSRPDDNDGTANDGSDRARLAREDAKEAAALAAKEGAKPPATGKDAPEAGRDDGLDDDKPNAPPELLMPVTAMPEKYDEKIKDIESRGDDLEKKWEDGDLTIQEFRKGMRELTEERTVLDQQKFKAEISQDAARQATINQWNRDVSGFLDDNPRIKGNIHLMRTYDSILGDVTSDEKYAKLSNRKQLDIALAEFNKAMGYTPEVKPGKTTTTKDGKPTPNPQRVSKKLPPTLANIPAADENDVENGKWAELDALGESDPMAYEAAFAKLSDADREAYLQA